LFFFHASGSFPDRVASLLSTNVKVQGVNSLDSSLSLSLLLLLLGCVVVADSAVRRRAAIRHEQHHLRQEAKNKALFTQVSLWCRWFSDSPPVAALLTSPAFQAVVANQEQAYSAIDKLLDDNLPKWCESAGLQKSAKDITEGTYKALKGYFMEAIFRGRFVGCPWAAPCDDGMTNDFQAQLLDLSSKDEKLATFGKDTGGSTARTLFQALDNLCAQIWDNTKQNHVWSAFATKTAQISSAGYVYEGSFVEAIANKTFASGKYGDAANQAHLHALLKRTGELRTTSTDYPVPRGTNPTCPMGPFCGQALKELLGKTSKDTFWQTCGQHPSKPTYKTEPSKDVACPATDLAFLNAQVEAAAADAFKAFDANARDGGFLKTKFNSIKTAISNWWNKKKKL